MKKKTELFQLLSNPSYDKKTLEAVAQAANAMPETHGTETSFATVAPQISQLKIEHSYSNSGILPSSYSKQIKMQQMQSDQASAAIHGQVTNPNAVQAILSVAQSAGASGQERQEIPAIHNQHVMAAHQILQSSGQQMALPNNQPSGVFASRDPQYGKVSSGLHVQQKQNSQSLFTSEDPAQTEKGIAQKSGQPSSEISNSGFYQMRSRSPHSNNFSKWGHQHTAPTKTQIANPSTLSASGASLALKMFPISESK